MSLTDDLRVQSRGHHRDGARKGVGLAVNFLLALVEGVFHDLRPDDPLALLGDVAPQPGPRYYSCFPFTPPPPPPPL
eukprot:6220327-Pyramimonas_sp.AAC.1